MQECNTNCRPPPGTYPTLLMRAPHRRDACTRNSAQFSSGTDIWLTRASGNGLTFPWRLIKMVPYRRHSGETERSEVIRSSLCKFLPAPFGYRRTRSLPSVGTTRRWPRFAVAMKNQHESARVATLNGVPEVPCTRRTAAEMGFSACEGRPLS